MSPWAITRLIFSPTNHSSPTQFVPIILSPGVSQYESLKWHFVTWLIPVSLSVHVPWAGANPLSYRWGNQGKTSYGTDCWQRLNAIIIKAIWRRSQLMSLASSSNESYGPATLGRLSLCMVEVPFPLSQMPFTCQILAHAFILRLVPSSLPRQSCPYSMLHPL